MLVLLLIFNIDAIHCVVLTFVSSVFPSVLQFLVHCCTNFRLVYVALVQRATKGMRMVFNRALIALFE